MEGTLLKLLRPAEPQGKAFKEGIMQQYIFSCLVKNHSIKYFDTNNSKVCTSITFVKAVFQNTIVKLCLRPLRPLSDYLTAISLTAISLTIQYTGNLYTGRIISIKIIIINLSIEIRF